MQVEQMYTFVEWLVLFWLPSQRTSCLMPVREIWKTSEFWKVKTEKSLNNSHKHFTFCHTKKTVTALLTQACLYNTNLKNIHLENDLSLWNFHLCHSSVITLSDHIVWHIMCIEARSIDFTIHCFYYVKNILTIHWQSTSVMHKSARKDGP